VTFEFVVPRFPGISPDSMLFREGQQTAFWQ